jgi:hypothetical protein
MQRRKLLPKENLHPDQRLAPQGEQVPKILEWAKSDVGCGLTQLQRVLDHLLV